MAIPLATTTIAVLRLPTSEDYLDPYEEQPERSKVVSGVRAHISTSSGREQVAGGQQSTVEFRLSCDPIDLHHTDRVLDETTGAVFEVVWSFPRQGIGMDHRQAGLRMIEGLA